MSTKRRFPMPKSKKITQRISTITNSFVNAIIPAIPPSEAEQAESLRILELDAEDLRCIYCGNKASMWEHLRPVVKVRRPTGFISEIANLVPACNQCNESKRNEDWKTWMRGNAKNSPYTRGIPDIEDRIRRLDAYVIWGSVQPINLAEFVGEDLWNLYWDNLQLVIEAMKTSQQVADQLKQVVKEKHSYERKI